MVFLPACNPSMCGKTFRESLKRPSPILETAGKGKIRVVPAFTIQALQRNTCVLPPPQTGVFRASTCEPTKFRDAYFRQELPIYIEFIRSGGRRVSWKIPVEKLDLTYYLPIFVSGLCEGTIPFDFLVDQGLKDIFTKAGHRVLACLPLIVIPLQEAMRTKNPRIIIKTMQCLQRMCKLCSNVGPALVPYYRYFLPEANLILLKGRRKPGIGEHLRVIVPEEDVIYMIESTFEVLEIYGGPDAFLNIKYHVPVYESCIKN